MKTMRNYLRPFTKQLNILYVFFLRLPCACECVYLFYPLSYEITKGLYK